VEAIPKEDNLMKAISNAPLITSYIVVVSLFLFFCGGAMTGGMMNDGGWTGERSWMWTPAILTLGLGVVLGWAIVKKKG